MSSPPLRVTVEPAFLPDESDPAQGLFTFAYTVTITNEANTAMQVVARHWQIDDGSGHREEVRGLGVVGQQPLLAPGASFTYTSGCRLRSPRGSMQGSYLAVSEAGDCHTVPIELFVLDAGAAAGGDSARVLH